MNDGVPLIDSTPARRAAVAERQAVAARIDEACREIGFFAIGGHGVPARIVDDLRASAHEFFALPLADKLVARHPVAGTNRGYHPVGGEALSKANDAAAPPDLKEFFHVGPVESSDDRYYTSALGRQHFSPNIWPAVPAGFASAATAYYRAMDQLIVFLMRLAALALRVDETFFDDKVDRSIGTMRLNYYPAQAVPPFPASSGRAPTPTMAGSRSWPVRTCPAASGLDARRPVGHVATTPESFVVNIGDLLMRWTNDRWLSNMHRVVNPPLGGAPSRPRLSIAFFNHPNYDTLIECLPSQGEAKHPPVRSGEYRDLKYSKTGLARALAPAG